MILRSRDGFGNLVDQFGWEKRAGYFDMCADFQEVIKVAMNFQVCFWFITRGQKETTGASME